MTAVPTCERLNCYQTRAVHFMSREVLDTRDRRMPALGIAGEGGEYNELIKKEYYHGIPSDREKVKKELGDILWYIAAAALLHDFTLQDIAETNIAKLMARYPDGPVLGGGIRTGDGA